MIALVTDEALAQICPEYANRIMERAAGDLKEQKGNQYLMVAGDFNGDDHVDRAFFAKKAGKLSLLVCFHGHKPAIEAMNFPFDGNFFIKTAPPGVYIASCARETGPRCRRNQLEELKLGRTAIQFFDYEKSSRLIYWAGDGFKEFWLED